MPIVVCDVEGGRLLMCLSRLWGRGTTVRARFLPLYTSKLLLDRVSQSQVKLQTIGIANFAAIAYLFMHSIVFLSNSTFA